MPWAAAAAAVGVIGGALISSKGSKDAAQTQADAANKASDNTMAMYNQSAARLAPYTALGGQSTQDSLLRSMGYTPQFDSTGALSGLTKDPNNILNTQFNGGPAFSFAPKDLQNYPGYQFALSQGMRANDASAAARGLGVSGADIRGASQFATGLAQQTYGQAYDQSLGTYQTNYGNALNAYNTNYSAAAQNANRLAGLVQTGQNSAAMVGTQGANAAATSGNFATSGAAATAAGTVGAANALTGAIGQGLNYNMQQQYLNKMPNTNTNLNSWWSTPSVSDSEAASGGN